MEKKYSTYDLCYLVLVWLAPEVMMGMAYTIKAVSVLKKKSFGRYAETLSLSGRLFLWGHLLGSADKAQILW